jgi:hypothetical protein
MSRLLIVTALLLSATSAAIRPSQFPWRGQGRRHRDNPVLSSPKAPERRAVRSSRSKAPTSDPMRCAPRS